MPPKPHTLASTVGSVEVTASSSTVLPVLPVSSVVVIGVFSLGVPVRGPGSSVRAVPDHKRLGGSTPNPALERLRETSRCSGPRPA